MHQLPGGGRKIVSTVEFLGLMSDGLHSFLKFLFFADCIFICFSLFFLCSPYHLSVHAFPCLWLLTAHPPVTDFSHQSPSAPTLSVLPVSAHQSLPACCHRHPHPSLVHRVPSVRTGMEADKCLNRELQNAKFYLPPLPCVFMVRSRGFPTN